MFGLQNVNTTEKWLQSDPTRKIEITDYAGSCTVKFIQDTLLVTQGSAAQLMDALKAALAGLPK